MAAPTDSSGADDAPSDRRVRSNAEQSISVGERVAWIAVALGVAGLALGLVPAIYGSVGEETIQNEDQTEELSEEEQQQRDVQWTNQTVQVVNQLAPYFALLLSVVAGIAVGVSGRGAETDIVAGAAVGAFVGVVLFMLLSSGVAVTQWTADPDTFYDYEITLDYGATAVNGLAIGVSGAIGAAGAAFAGTKLTA